MKSKVVRGVLLMLAGLAIAAIPLVFYGYFTELFWVQSDPRLTGAELSVIAIVGAVIALWGVAMAHREVCRRRRARNFASFWARQ